MGSIFRIGDRIMQTKNNYDMYWERREGDSIETGNGVFNGEIGTITNINEKEKFLIDKYMPGALTIILDKNEKVSDILTAGLDTIGVRIPKNNISLRILENVSYPLATTSANISGDSAGIKISDFLKEFDGVVDAIIDGGETDLKVASTIVRVESDNKLKIIREGTLKIKEM